MAKRSSTGLNSLSLQDLKTEINRRQRKLPALARARQKLLTKLAALDGQIASLSGLGSKGPSIGTYKGKGGKRKLAVGNRTGSGRRPAGTGLVDVLHKAIAGKTVSIEEAIKLTKEAGYVSESPNFKVMVNAALLKKSHFKRVARGQYTTV